MKGTAVFLVEALRTPFGRYGGALALVRPDDLLAGVLRVLVDRTGIPEDVVDEVIAGCVSQAGEDNRNVARMALLLSGLPVTTPGVTVNRLCASGLSAVALGARTIAAGEAEIVIAAGVESMSRAPYVMAKPERAFQNGTPKVFDSTIGWRFVNPTLASMYPPISMGETAENLAVRYSISREAQDVFALGSHQRALSAWSEGFYDDHVVPVMGPSKEKPVTVDEGPRPDTSLDALAHLRPAFVDGGTISAGNSSSLNDGAGAALLATEKACKRYGLQPICRIVATGQAGVDPSYMGIGPVPATERALQRAGWRLSELDVIEINEAFAAQVLAVLKELNIDAEAVNTHGGAIALGHPLGATGLRLIATICRQMRLDPSARRALATACIGVGQGESLLLEQV
jgi:acetyl-CoA acyltransferase